VGGGAGGRHTYRKKIKYFENTFPGKGRDRTPEKSIQIKIK
jgi:hypothetical protein